MMHIYEDVKDMLEKELEDVAKSGEITAGTLEAIDKLTHSIKSIYSILMADEYSEDGYSRHYGNGRTRGGNSYARRRRDSRGRYSRDDMDDEMMDKLDDYMRRIDDPQKRAEVQKLMSKLETM